MGTIKKFFILGAFAALLIGCGEEEKKEPTLQDIIGGIAGEVGSIPMPTGDVGESDMDMDMDFDLDTGFSE